ncbi:Hypothetical protein R9X50_00467300 [Acrodontium crateriforme]|uniref:Uncharacterized protein n=1 Tax=Acrodontium crateriforme TaxID=150365 RepID=A0AAQ3M516_9PEZI|nr:Hypothetical protein R9X50_00467300 [Acrodontium crateriforme]
MSPPQTIPTVTANTPPIQLPTGRISSEPAAAADDIPEGADSRARELPDLDSETQKKMDSTAATSSLSPQTPLKRDQKLHPQPIAVSPARHPYPPGVAASPSRLRSSSPRLHSPASSEIFERNVQEPIPMSALQGELDQAHIPAHMITEDHIPPALEASAQAITSNTLDADEVEIVTSASHLPAAASVADLSNSQAEFPHMHSSQIHSSHVSSPTSVPFQKLDGSEPASFSQHSSGFLPSAGEEDGASTYGQLDPNDVRRLSFISFADVVQSEQQHPPSSLREMSSRDSLSLSQDRTGSPLRSPRSPTSMHSQTLGSGAGAGVTTPPGMNVNLFGSELSPARSGMSQHGELTIETMRQAVRKTASGDLGSTRTVGMSPISDETPLRRTRSRENS